MDVAFPFMALVKRELLASLRQKRTFALLGLSVGLLFVITSLMAAQGMGAGGSREFFAVFIGILYAAACLFVTPVAANSVCVERQQGTFDLLFGTLIRPLGIVAAKMTSVLAVYLFVLVTSLPFVGVLFFFVGIDARQFICVIVSLLVLAVACSAIGVLSSTLCRRTFAAISVGYVGLLAFMGAPTQLLSILALSLRSPLPHWFKSLVPVGCPPVLLVEILSQDASVWHVAAGFAYQGVFIGVCVFGAVRVMKRPGMQTIVQPMLGEAAPPPTGRSECRVIPDGSNPVFAKERFVGSIWSGCTGPLFLGVFLLTTVFLGCLHLSHSAPPASGSATILVLLAAMLLAMTPAVVAGAMAKEREQGNLDLLRTTLLSPREVILGKAIGALVAFAPFLIASVLYMIVGLSASFASLQGIVWAATTIGSMLAGVLVVTCLSLCVSLTAKHTSTALVRSYGAAILSQMLLPLAVGSLCRYVSVRIFTGTGSNPFRLADFLWPVPSPVAFQIACLDHNYKERAGFAFATWMGNMCICLVCSGLLLYCAVWTYARYIARDR